MTVPSGPAGVVSPTTPAIRIGSDERSRDPLTLVAVVVIFCVTAIGASYVPARRATRVDPLTALRAE